MKKYSIFTIALLFLFSLSACGSEENGETTWRGISSDLKDLTAIIDRTEYYDIFVKQEDIFKPSPWEKNPPDEYVVNSFAHGSTVYVHLGTQFYQGEPVQFWAEDCPGDIKGNPAYADIYLYRKDGSRELLLQDFPLRYTSPDHPYQWYRDPEGDFYCYRNMNYSILNQADTTEKAFWLNTSLVKILSTGEILYENTLDPGISIMDICQSADGSVYLILWSEEEDCWKLAEADPESGHVTLLEDGDLQSSLLEGASAPCLGMAEGDLAVLGFSLNNGYELAKCNADNGSMEILLSFNGTSYEVQQENLWLREFQVLQGGTVECIRTDSDHASGSLEQLQMVPVEKIPVVIRGTWGIDQWVSERAAWFNRENDTYHVILEDCGSGQVEDFARLTSIQMAAGKGPDILCGEKLLQDYVDGMLEKGAFEELSTYMADSGLKEEEYFPLTFATWRDGDRIYSVNPMPEFTGYWVDVSILGQQEKPDIGRLLDGLLDRKEDGIYLSGKDSAQLLELFLKGSYSLWGMVDWEEGICDFSSPLFTKLLEAARRFADDGRKEAASIAKYRRYFNIFEYDSPVELADKGRVPAGVLFDEGCYAAVASRYVLAINANSIHKEGAWEFICFLLGEKSQDPGIFNRVPVNKKAFDTWMEAELEGIEDENGIERPKYSDASEDNSTPVSRMVVFTKEDITDEKIVAYRKAIEEARPYPVRTVPILNIIQEEAAEYFNGIKSVQYSFFSCYSAFSA